MQASKVFNEACPRDIFPRDKCPWDKMPFFRYFPGTTLDLVILAIHVFWLVPLSCPRDYFVIVPGTYVPETYFPGTYFPGTWYLNKKGNWSQGLQLKHRERACCTYVQLGHISQGHVFSRKTRQPTFWAGLAEPLDPPPWSQIVFFVWRPS